LLSKRGGASPVPPQSYLQFHRPMRRRFALVFNSTAGVAIPRRLDGVLRRMRARGADVFQIAARSSTEAAEAIAEAGRRRLCDAVIAAGGDGTFRAVATGAAECDLPIGLIPLGTGNVLANEIGLPKKAHDLADLFIDGPEIEAKGGLINGVPFFLMVGAGFDAHIVGRLNYRTKRVLGRGAYTVPVLSTLADQPRMFDVDLVGRHFEASWLILAFANRYAGSFLLSRDGGVGRDQLIAIVVEARSRTAMVGHVLSLALGRLANPGTRPAGVHVLPVTRAMIGQRTGVPLEVDGDEGGLSPAEISAAGPRIRLIVPQSYVADLTDRHTNRVR
jgi:diacylglycerol kinase family enzyme